MEVRGKEGKLVKSKENKTKNGNETKIRGKGGICLPKAKKALKVRIEDHFSTFSISAWRSWPSSTL